MKPEKAQMVVQGLKEAGVDFTAGVPDAQFIEVYKMLADDPDIRYVGTANEAEAVGVGFGAWFGGKKPALILATSGLAGGDLSFGAHQFLARSSAVGRNSIPRRYRRSALAGAL